MQVTRFSAIEVGGIIIPPDATEDEMIDAFLADNAVAGGKIPIQEVPVGTCEITPAYPKKSSYEKMGYFTMREYDTGPVTILRGHRIALDGQVRKTSRLYENERIAVNYQETLPGEHLAKFIVAQSKRGITRREHTVVLEAILAKRDDTPRVAQPRLLSS